MQHNTSISGIIAINARPGLLCLIVADKHEDGAGVLCSLEVWT